MILLPLFGHLLEFAAALLVLGVSAAVGRFVLRRLGGERGDELEEVVFSAALGVGVVGTLYLAQGLVAIQPASVWATLLLLAFLTRRDGHAVLTTAARLARLGLARIKADPAAAGVALLLTGAALLLLRQAVGPPTDWDSLMYHLEVPRQFLEEGRVFLPPDNLHVTRVGMVHFLYLPLLVVGDSGPALLSAFLTLLLALAVLACGRRFLSPAAGLLGVVLLFGTSTILLVAVTPRVDATLALYALLAQYALLLALAREKPGPPFVLAALLLGFAVGVKYHGLVVAAAAAPLVLWVAVRRWEGAHRVRALGVFAAVAAAVGLPWLAKNVMLVGGPLYPFLAPPMVQPWLAEILGTASFPASVDPSMLDFIWQLREPFNLADAFLDPGQLSIELEGAWYFTAPALALLPLAIRFVRRSEVLWLTVPAALYLAILLLSFPRANLRYLLPAVPPLTLVTGYAILKTLARLKRPVYSRLLLALVVVVTLLPPGLAASRWLMRTRGMEFLLGRIDPVEYMASHPDLSVRALSAALRFANDSLPGEASVLMLLEARGFPFKARTLQDNKGTNWPLLRGTPAEAGCLAGAGITHVLFGTGALRYYALGGLEPERLGFGDAFEAFKARCLESLFQDGSFVLYRLRDEPREGGTARQIAPSPVPRDP